MRTVLVGIAAVVLVAGCGGGGANGPVHLTATPATIDEQTLATTGYEPGGGATDWVNTTLSVSIEGDVELQASKDVRARAPVRTYRRETGDGPAVVGLLSVPAVHLLEASADIVRNPAHDLGPADLARRLPSGYSDLEVGEQVANTSVTMLGNETFMATYATTASIDGSTADVHLSIATVRHSDTFVTFVAIQPAAAADAARLRQLLAGVDH